MSTPKRSLLLYCQHSVGMGHLMRSLALAEALAERFQVVLLSGGAFPAEIRPPAGVRVVALPPLGHDGGYELVSRDPSWTLERAQQERVAVLLEQLRTVRPDVLLIELYPFGRRKFAFELLPLLEAAGPEPLVVCSLRDILVASRRDQARHDEQASLVANRWFDAVLVHADPRFARLEESFSPSTPLTVPVHYTGFVSRPSPSGSPTEPRRARVCVSAGGGLVGAELFAAAAAAAPALYDSEGLTTSVVTGPFLPAEARAPLHRAAAESPHCLEVLDFVPDLAGRIRTSAVSVSQCGYNTVMDLLGAGTPAVVVPYAEGREDEQTRRAQRLAGLGAVSVLDAAELSPRTFAIAVRRARIRPPAPAPDLALDGAARTVACIDELLSEQRPRQRQAERVP